MFKVGEKKVMLFPSKRKILLENLSDIPSQWPNLSLEFILFLQI